MWNPSPAKAAAYKKAFCIGLLLTCVQLFILFFLVASRTLGADTIHSVGDLLTLGGTALLLAQTWANEDVFLKKRRMWLSFGAWSLALGGLFIAAESSLDLWHGGASVQLRAWPLFVAALGGALGNWWMHHTVHSATHVHRDALDRNNLDHMFWDGVLSFAVFLSYVFGTTLIDHVLAIVIGAFVLPFLAWKRWKEDGDDHGAERTNEHTAHGHDEHHHHR